MTTKISIQSFLLLTTLLGSSMLATAVELREFKDAEQEQRFNTLAKELRCLVCQNQSLADSDAALAKDLREQIHAMLQDGSSDKEITDYMVARYGAFILYSPPLESTTFLLWFGPFIFVSLAAVILIFYLLKRTETKTSDLTSVEERKKRMQAMMAKLDKKETDNKRNTVE